MRIVVALAALLALASCSAPPREVRDISLPPSARDELVHAGVKAKLATVDIDSTTRISVAVHDGVVTLAGRVRTAADRSAYTADAKSVAGVRDVVDHLRIDPKLGATKNGTSDVVLAVRVTGALAAQTGVNAAKLQVSAIDGVVTIRGKLGTQAVKSTVLETARTVGGVKHVVDKIAVGT